MLDLVIFLSFYTMSLSFHAIGERVVKHAHNAAHAHSLATGAAFVFSHTPTAEALREFLTHVVVYSGYVIPKH